MIATATSQTADAYFRVLVGQTLRGVLVELRLTAEQQDLLPGVVRKHLTVIASTVLNSPWSTDPQLDPPP